MDFLSSMFGYKKSPSISSMNRSYRSRDNLTRRNMPLEKATITVDTLDYSEKSFSNQSCPVTGHRADSGYSDNSEGCPFSKPIENMMEIPHRQSANEEPTILEILGEDRVEQIVERFYHYNLTDKKTRLFFQGINIERLQRMQTVFLVHLLGGKPINMRKMRSAHKRLLDLNDGHFDAVMKNLMRAAKDLKVPRHLRERILDAAEVTRDDVLGRTPVHEHHVGH
ncbi:globin-like protein [Basidiobolus meristosporus CBS 931.73]|uniref:Globin-like protein n=1 Tax=Basidiobolus meristosporus CBS 931.73 TaxID=1314790 RepID=A0A1Y1Z958_9FUNG|nr:globin-like protein [Basidiobolus meristosporus CBS 931.73]|eukprot:ORY06798.1 globin-like protein [Basidiobolus meristosporus CBS 931.73]